MRTILMVALACTILPLPASGQELSPGRRAAMADTLVRTVSGWLGDLRSLDAEAALALYGRRDEFVHIENGSAVPWAALRPEMRSYLESAGENDIRWLGPPSVMVLGEDAAVVYGAHLFRGEDDADAHSGQWTGVFQRIDGRWALVHSHSSDAPPEPGG